MALLLVGGRAGEAQKPPPPVGTRLKAPLAALGDQGRTLFQVSQGPTGAVVQVFDNDGSQLARIADDGQFRAICSFDDDGVLATLAGIEREPEGEVERKVACFTEEATEAAALLHVGVEGVGELSGMTVFDQAGQYRVFTGIDPFFDTNGVTTFDADGDVELQVGHLPNLGRTAMAIYASDAQGNGLQAVVESEGPGGGKIQLFDAAGVETFHAP